MTWQDVRLQFDVPAGWRKVYGEDSRDACLQFIEQSWSDISPAGLAQRPAP